nr:hypothetical protein [uncultured Flavobacterium sp.]
MEEDEINEEIFNTILRNGWTDISPFDNREYSRVAIALKCKGYLVTPHINTNIFELSKTGEEVLQAGGWKSYNLAKAKEKKILDDKQFYEYKISKFKYYTLWPALVLGIVGGIYSIVEMAKSYAESKPKIESTNEPQKLKVSPKSKKDSTNINPKKVEPISVNSNIK